MGGTTHYRVARALPRRVEIFISHAALVGLGRPFAGFMLAGLAHFGLDPLLRSVCGLRRHVAPRSGHARASPSGQAPLGQHRLGRAQPDPGAAARRRARARGRARAERVRAPRAMISLGRRRDRRGRVHRRGELWPRCCFGMGAVHAARRLHVRRAGEQAQRAPRRAARPAVPGGDPGQADAPPPARPETTTTPQATSARQRGRADAPASARRCCRGSRSRPTRCSAWAAHLRGDSAEAAALAEGGESSTARRRGAGRAPSCSARRRAAARKVLEQARAAGDQRKEIVGPLIADPDRRRRGGARRGGGLRHRRVAVRRGRAQDGRDRLRGRAFDWAARLYEAVFARTSDADDAYERRAPTRRRRQQIAPSTASRERSAPASGPRPAWSDAALEAAARRARARRPCCRRP